jgi:peroxiredoxin
MTATLLALTYVLLGPIDFQLPDVSGRPRTLREWRDHRAVVIAFLGVDCPVARRYAARLNDVARDYQSKGVAVVAVFSNPGDDAAAVGRLRDELGIGYPLLLDAKQALARRLGATRQSEVVVLDQSGRVRYRGRVDDQFSPGAHKARASRPDLRIALDELVAGKPVSVSLTLPAGCPIERPAPLREAPFTYRDVAPILNRRCVACHREEGIAPFSLRDPAVATRWADAITEAVRDRRMPPWHADPRYGRFANDPSLSESERQTLLHWAANGAQAGAGADVPTPAPPRAWSISTPDRVVAIPEPFVVPPSGDVPYQYIEVDPGFCEDTWVQEAEIQPGNRSVVHHVTVFLRPPGYDGLAKQGELGSFCLCAYAMGTPPMAYPVGMAKKIPAGWRFVFVLHYVPNGKETRDQTVIGLKLADRKQVHREVATNILLAEEMSIPAGCPQYIETRSRVFEKDVLLLALFPHMHLRGVSFRYDATYPDGKSETLLSVPRWDINWQHRYVLAEPKRLPAGTILTAIGVYDNSAANANNPDPTVDVRGGPQTTDEMFNGYYDFCLADEGVGDSDRRTRHAWALAAAAAVCAGIILLRRRRGDRP